MVRRGYRFVGTVRPANLFLTLDIFFVHGVAALFVVHTLLPRQVPINADPAQTVRDFWRMVGSAAAAAAAITAAAAQPGDNTAKATTEEVVAAAAAAAAAALSSNPGGDCSDNEEEGTGGGADGATSAGEFVLPHGQVLMRQQQTSSVSAAAAGSAQSVLLTGDGAEGFLWCPDDVLGDSGCRLEDGEELVLVRYH